VAAVLIAAVELTIVWNDIPDVDWFTDLAQTLPVFVSAGFVVRTVFLHFAVPGEDESESEGESSVRESRRSYSSHPSRAWDRPPGRPRPPPPAAHRM